MPSAPQHPPTAHTATARSAEPALLRDPEARQGRPGAPGGQKEQRDAAKARARERAKAPSGDAATAVRLSHRRRLLQSNSSSNSTSNNGNSSSTVLNANQKILGTVTGKIDVCQNGYPSGGMATVSDWFLSTINGDTTVINPSVSQHCTVLVCFCIGRALRLTASVFMCRGLSLARTRREISTLPTWCQCTSNLALLLGAVGWWVGCHVQRTPLEWIGQLVKWILGNWVSR